MLEKDELLDKINNDTYFTEIVEEFCKERTVENYINVCKVLQYRDFYIGAIINVKDHHYRAVLKHEGYLPEDVMQDETKVDIEPLKVEIRLGIHKETALCIFTDSSKIDLKKTKCNGIMCLDLKTTWEKYFESDEIAGFVINLGKEEVMIPYDYIKYMF